jgi:hypothetical protein
VFGFQGESTCLRKFRTLVVTERKVWRVSLALCDNEEAQVKLSWKHSPSFPTVRMNLILPCRSFHYLASNRQDDHLEQVMKFQTFCELKLDLCTSGKMDFAETSDRFCSCSKSVILFKVMKGESAEHCNRHQPGGCDNSKAPVKGEASARKEMVVLRSYQLHFPPPTG